MVPDHLQSINQLNYMLNLNHFWDPGALLFRDQVLSLGPGSISYLQCDLGHHLPLGTFSIGAVLSASGNGRIP